MRPTRCAVRIRRASSTRRSTRRSAGIRCRRAAPHRKRRGCTGAVADSAAVRSSTARSRFAAFRKTTIAGPRPGAPVGDSPTCCRTSSGSKPICVTATADYHGNDGPIPIYRAPMSNWGPVDLTLAEAAVDLGYPWAPDHNAPGALGVSPYAINSREHRRVNTNDAYVEPSRGRNNLAMLCDTQVDKVLFDGDRAIGVRCVTNGRWHDIHANEVILSAGAVHSPPILMRSGIGPADHLRDLGIDVRVALPVGDSFQDHPIAGVPDRPEDRPRYRRRIFATRTAACATRRSSAAPGPGDMMLVAMNRLGDGLGRHTRAPTPNFGLIGVWVNECFSRGTIRLASADPLAQPIIEENMLADRERRPADARRHQTSDRPRAPAWVRRRSPNSIGIGATTAGIDTLDSDAAIDAWAMQNAGDTQHGTSSCRMGSERRSADVVDPAVSRARRTRPARDRCVDHAERVVREYAPHHRDDRGTHGRPTQECMTCRFDAGPVAQEPDWSTTRSCARQSA